MSQDTPSVRPPRRSTRAALAALALPALLGLAACDGVQAASAAKAVAVGPAVDSAAEHDAVCTKVDAAWAAFEPGAYTVGVLRIHGVAQRFSKINYSDFYRVSTGLFDSLTGNRDFQLAYDIDNLATDAGNVYHDPGQQLSPKPDLAALAKDAPVVAKDCGTKLKVPTSPLPTAKVPAAKVPAAKAPAA